MTQQQDAFFSRLAAQGWHTETDPRKCERIRSKITREGMRKDAAFVLAVTLVCSPVLATLIDNLV